MLCLTLTFNTVHLDWSGEATEWRDLMLARTHRRKASSVSVTWIDIVGPE
jgi:hypothetical protein